MNNFSPVTSKTIAAARAKHAARTVSAERKHLAVDAPACALPPNTTDDLTESKEEREAFELLERRQQDPQLIDNRQAKINAMAAIARQCPTTSIEGICALLVDAGYGEVVKHG